MARRLRKLAWVVAIGATINASMLIWGLSAVLAISTILPAAQNALTDEQVTQAIALGRQLADASVHVGTSRDFDVYIGGPMSRVAAAAARATRAAQPFNASDVPAALKTRAFVVTVLSKSGGRYLAAGDIMLQPKGSKGTSDLMQPLTEDGNVDSLRVGRQAVFDHLPDGDFDIIVTTLDGEQRFSVPAAMRAQIE